MKSMKSVPGTFFSLTLSESKIHVYGLVLYRAGIGNNRAREIDKCKSVQPFHKQSAISVSFTETTNRPYPRSWKLPIGSFHNDRPFPNIR